MIKYINVLISLLVGEYELVVINGFIILEKSQDKKSKDRDGE